MTHPNFFVVGAGRCGTTMLHQVLGRHPDVFVPARKSPNHYASHLPQPPWETAVARAMARQWVRDSGDYAALFDGVTDERAVGDVSPVYLQALDVAARIHDAQPESRIVAILRDPVDRAHSHFVGRQRDGIETCASFAERVERELAAPLPDEVAFGHLLGCGRYHHFLTPYLARFGRERVGIFLYDDLVDDPAGTVADVFRFLDVDPSFTTDLSGRPNRTGVIRQRPVRAVWTRTAGVRTALRPHLPEGLRRAVGRRFLGDLDRPVLDPALRAQLVEIFADDVGRLELLLDRDLSHWRRT